MEENCLIALKNKIENLYTFAKNKIYGLLFEKDES